MRKDKPEKNLSAQVGKVLRNIAQNKDDFKIYLVGGVVRDLILEKEIFDVDITVEGDALKLARLLEEKGLGTIKQIQPDLKTAKMVFDGGTEIDFASTRKETYPKKGHMPVVTETGCPLREDISRRDFTINSLALSLDADDWGVLTDFVGGMADLESKEIRILHDLSFIDDPTRIIRALKFSVRLGFTLEEKTKKFQDDYLQNHLSMDICWSRIKSELEQTFSLNNPKAFDLFVGQGIYKLINPAFDKKIDSALAFELIKKYSPDQVWLVYLAGVLLGSPAVELLGFSKAQKKVITDTQALLSADFPPDNFGVYKFFSSASLEAVLVFYLLTNNSHALSYLDDLRQVKIEVSGSDLISMGLAPSEQFSEILDQILEEKLAGALTTLEDEINYLNFLIKQLKK